MLYNKELTIMKILTLDKYIINIFYKESIDIDYMIESLNNHKYPRGIMETLESVEGISKIEIYDKNSNELLLSTVIL
jgi:acyl-ACP thioesterase